MMNHNQTRFWVGDDEIETWIRLTQGDNCENDMILQ